MSHYFFSVLQYSYIIIYLSNLRCIENSIINYISENIKLNINNINSKYNIKKDSMNEVLF